MHIKSYVIRQARMSESQRRHYDEYFPQFQIPYIAEANSLTEYIDTDKKLVVEIGFGMGDATAEIAANTTDTQFIGIEVHKPGVGKLVRNLVEGSITNVHIINHDAVEVLRDMIPSGMLEGLHIFFPDPWPKKRHHKRRLIQPEFISLAAERVRPGGYIYIVTDWEDYAEQILRVCSSEPLLQNQADGYHPALSWRPHTAFEAKGVAKEHTIRELFFRRNGAR